MPRKSFYPQRENKNIIAKKIILALAVPVLMPFEPFSKTHPWARGAHGKLESKLLYPSPEKIDEKKIRQSLYVLKKRGYIKLTNVDNKGKFNLELTKKGQEALKGYEFQDLEIEKPKNWDGKWSFVMFDIPEKSRYARDVLRDKLESMEFFRVQQSVWVYPYPCDKEKDFITEFLGIRGGVLVFTGKVSRDIKLKLHFNKIGFSL